MTSSADSEPSPCQNEAKLWRECMKDIDYHPDKNFESCGDKRIAYYACVNQWRRKHGLETAATAKKPLFSAPEPCSLYTHKLHECMQVKMFEISGCTKEMDDLKECAKKNDPEVAKALSEPPVRTKEELFPTDEDFEGTKRKKWFFF